MGSPGDRPPRAASLPAGHDDEDPYAGEDLDSYPEWWRDHVETFRDHGMRPYRPPRFADGTVTTEVVDRLETDLGVSVRLRSAPDTDGWALFVDDDLVASVPRRRDGDGYTVYEVTTERVERLVRDAVD